jgi:drug/metabolite transporter (DMT)-like permease
MPKLRNWLGLAGIVMAWGSAFLLINIAVEDIDPLVITAVRLWIGVILMGFTVWLLGRPFPTNPRHWGYFLLVAIFGNCLPFYLIAWGQQFIDSGEAGILMATVPLQVVLMAHFFIPSERLNGWRGLGYIIGFVGVIILFEPSQLSGLLSADAQAGRLAVFAGGICYAISTILAQKQPTKDPYSAALGVLILASILSATAMLVTNTPITLSASPAAMLSVAGLGVFATGGAMVLYFYLARHGGAGFLSLTNYLVPCVAAAIGAWVAGETLGTSSLVALVIILIGIAISQRHRKTPATPAD